ncbi:MAG TPA: RidA family protein [Bryobacteraceae bacterium]|jgi:reactive intermediate/imine deaminase|nr:RidA family protein [Bryobacteraceae bacterium]
MKTLSLFLLSAAALAAANVDVVFPPGAKPVGPYSPGILTSEYLYVSGQGARQADGKFPPTFEGQVQQCLENIKTIVEAAHLTMEHVVYTQIYLTDVSKYELMNPVLAKYFTRNPPARATVGVYRMPIDTPVEISAVAVRDLSRKKAIVPPGYKIAGPFVPGVQVGDRVFISGFLGRDPATGKVPEDPAEQVQMALDRFHTVLAAAGLDWGNVVFVNPYMTKEIPMGVMNRVYARHFEFGNTPARATIPVHALPMGAHMEFTGIAVAGAANRKPVRPKNMAPSATASPCVFAGDTYYCSAKSGFIPGVNGGIWAASVEDQVRQTMRNLLDGLEEAGLDFSHVVASNVYLDNIDDFAKMNGVYGKYFKNSPPTRTTVSPLPPVDRTPDAAGHPPKLEEISIIAVK